MATASPSSASERASAGVEAEQTESDARGQLSPTAALVAVAAVGMGLSLYATVFAGAVPTTDREVAEPTLERVHDAVVSAGVADPSRLDFATSVGAEGYRLRVSLRLADNHWSAGPTPPADGVDVATRRTAIRTEPGRVRSGQLRVVVWR